MPNWLCRWGCWLNFLPTHCQKSTETSGFPMIVMKFGRHFPARRGRHLPIHTSRKSPCQRRRRGGAVCHGQGYQSSAPDRGTGIARSGTVGDFRLPNSSERPSSSRGRSPPGGFPGGNIGGPPALVSGVGRADRTAARPTLHSSRQGRRGVLGGEVKYLGLLTDPFAARSCCPAAGFAATASNR